MWKEIVQRWRLRGQRSGTTDSARDIAGGAGGTPRIPAIAIARGVARRRGDLGMTLLEIMIVLAIIALITGSVGLAVFGALKRGRVKTAKIAVKEIAGAAQQFMMDNNNKCPAGIDDLVAQRFLPKKPYKDPWNNDFVLRCPAADDGDGVDVLSHGPDKAEGTADDIKSGEQ